MIRSPNHYKIRCIALQAQALALAANLWWAVNDGWAAVDGGSLETGQIVEYRGSSLSKGRFQYREKIPVQHDEFKVFIHLKMDVYSGEYTDALAQLQNWERQAVLTYLKRQPVAALSREKFERKNPDRYDSPKAPLYLTPPNLEHHLYADQLSAFMALAGWLLEPPVVGMVTKTEMDLLFSTKSVQ